MRVTVIALLTLVAGVGMVSGQQAPTGYDDTPMQPNGRWHIHDGKRPQPPIVTPGALSPSPPPQDATVLVGPAADKSAWQMMDGAPVTWAMADGVLSTGKGMIRTRAEFVDYQLHVEFATPKVVKGNSQERGNSGVFLNGKFEIQVLDSYQNVTYPDGQAAAMYGQYPPMVNASRPPGEWQSYDIAFRSPRFGAGGTLEKPAVVTVLHNGIVVHDGTAFWGPTAHKKIDPYTPDNARGPIALQDHGNPVRYRNIWIRPLKESSEAAEDDPKAIVAALDTQYQAAVKANDAATMDRILADDFVLVTGRGQAFKKADLLKDARGKTTIYEHQEEDAGSQTVRVFGDTAVVTALLWIKGTRAGTPTDYKLWFSDIYVRTAVGWKYAFGQASIALPKP